LPSDALSVNYAEAVRDLLSVLGLVNADQAVAVPANEIAAWLIRSLAAHVADQVSATGWYDVALLTTFEAARAAHSDTPTTLREVIAANVLIKATIDGKPCLLMQYDTEAHQFQLIGGKYEADDPDLAYTALREIREELDDPTLVVPADLVLVPLDQRLVQVSLSPTYGVVSGYDITFFHAQAMHFQPATNVDTCWLALDDIRTGSAPDGRRISPLALDVFGDQLGDLSDSLISSTQTQD